ncbi:MAG: hypothetical protein HWD90_02015 [Campylobacteraceae bacterium]|nr:hypothetical protein [Campylobacteraceae bacterium]
MDEMIYKLIEKYKSIEEKKEYMEYIYDDIEILKQTGIDLLTEVPILPALCALMSARWAYILNENYSIPAIVVAGDLKLFGNTIFSCNSNLPTDINSDTYIKDIWDGHCWIEINGIVADISIFRTAGEQDESHILNKYFSSSFGKNKGAFIAKRDHIPQELEYIPKYILSNTQIEALNNGLKELIKKCKVKG